MKFGVREICDVVLKAKSAQKIGNKIFYKNEPVIYFDTLKTSSMEGAATTVYAQGGRGNARLMAWEGERTVTFTMEDALISPEGFMILSGAGLIEADVKRDGDGNIISGKSIKQHITETIDRSECNTTSESIDIKISHKPYLPANNTGNYAYVMLVKEGEIISEPFIPLHGEDSFSGPDEQGRYVISITPRHDIYDSVNISDKDGAHPKNSYVTSTDGDLENVTSVNFRNLEFDSVIVDYYTEKDSFAKQIEITADKFGGNYYLEASTLFRDTNGVDMPAEFIIPNCKIQSNFNFTMASSGDPSTFTFTMDAFPDYTRFDHSKKVLAAIQIIEGDSGVSRQDLHRHSTVHEKAHDMLTF